MKNRSYMQALVDKRVAIGLFIWWLINLLQACSSYFVLDCKGELHRMTGTFLKMRG